MTASPNNSSVARLSRCSQHSQNVIHMCIQRAHTRPSTSFSSARQLLKLKQVFEHGRLPADFLLTRCPHRCRSVLSSRRGVYGWQGICCPWCTMRSELRTQRSGSQAKLEMPVSFSISGGQRGLNPRPALYFSSTNCLKGLLSPIRAECVSRLLRWTGTLHPVVYLPRRETHD